MGVKGLTTYIDQKSDVCYESYKLCNSVLIVDGYALAAYIYNSSSKIKSVFGGDYDLFRSLICNFFDTLKRCNVKPIVVCDGGYEKKKLSTVKQRHLRRVFAYKKITPTRNNAQCFPLMMRHVFKGTLLDIHVPVLQADFEADNEIAALAKKLDAPVLSNDSDFYIFDVPYIPLSTLEYYDNFSNSTNYYVSCQIFYVDNLLKSLGNLPKNMLPLIATLLGNDYTSASKFRAFYNRLKIDQGKALTPGAKRIKALVKWLNEETFQSAQSKILECLQKKTQRHAKMNIARITKCYTKLNTTLDEYLPYDACRKNDIPCEKVLELELADSMSNCCIDSDEESICPENDIHSPLSENENNEFADNLEDLSSDDDGDSDDEDDESGEDSKDLTESGEDSKDLTESGEDSKDLTESGNNQISIGINPKKNLIPSWLLNESRICKICPSIHTLLTLKIYFYNQQVEDYGYPFSGKITLPILQSIIGLLGLPSIFYWHRKNFNYVSSPLVAVNSVSEINFPKLEVLNELSISQRRLIILKTLMVENISVLEGCPDDWHLLLMSIVYWTKTIEDAPIKHWHLYSLIITIITVNVICSKVDSIWNKKKFYKKYGNRIRSSWRNDKPKNCSEFKTINESLSDVSFDDCLIALDCLIPYFHVDKKLKSTSNVFSRRIIHTYSQFQSTFELAVTLNSILLNPVKQCHLGNFYNGTFLYNFAVNFKNRKNILSYMKQFFKNAPSIYNLFESILNMLLLLNPSGPTQIVKPKKIKKRKEKISHATEENSVEDLSDTEGFNDVNNRFCLLNKKL